MDVLQQLRLSFSAFFQRHLGLVTVPEPDEDLDNDEEIDGDAHPFPLPPFVA